MPSVCIYIYIYPAGEREEPEGRGGEGDAHAPDFSIFLEQKESVSTGIRTFISPLREKKKFFSFPPFLEGIKRNDAVSNIIRGFFDPGRELVPSIAFDPIICINCTRPFLYLFRVTLARSCITSTHEFPDKRATKRGIWITKGYNYDASISSFLSLSLSLPFFSSRNRQNRPWFGRNLGIASTFDFYRSVTVKRGGGRVVEAIERFKSSSFEH